MLVNSPEGRDTFQAPVRHLSPSPPVTVRQRPDQHIRLSPAPHRPNILIPLHISFFCKINRQRNICLAQCPKKMQLQDGIALRTAEVTQASFRVSRLLCQPNFFALLYLAQLAWLPNAQPFSELPAPFQSWHLTIFSLWIARQWEQCSQFLINLLLISLSLKRCMHAGLKLTHTYYEQLEHVVSFQCKIGLNLSNVAPCLLLLFTAPRILFIPSHIPQGIPHLFFFLHHFPLLPPPTYFPAPL